MKVFKTFFPLLLFAAALLPSAATAQNGTMTPYSQFGYGILRDNATAAQQAMGGVGYGMNSGRQINVMNPASYARVDSITFLFDMGVDMTLLWANEDDGNGNRLSESNNGGGLNYVTMQFPVGKRMGMSVGLLPYSSVGYAFGNEINNGYSSRSGSGNINLLYAGVAGRIFQGLTLGVNLSYMFGLTHNDIYAITEEGNYSLYAKELSVRDFHLDVGLQYTQKINRNDELTLGLVWTPGKNLLGRLKTSATDTQTGTVTSESDIKTADHFSIASSYGIGLNYRHGQTIMAEADFTYQPWKDAKYMQYDENGSPVTVKGIFADRYKIAVGGYYQQTQRGNYFKRIQYRLGGYYCRDYMVVRQGSSVNNVREFGVSAGVGLPVPGFKSVVSLGIGWMQRQAYPTALIKENYLSITLGVNFNESWFRKSKIY